MIRGQFTNNDKGVVYKTRNIDAEDNRDIFVIFDEPHVVKTARNNVAHSAFENSGYYITWSHIFNLMMEDLECGLQLCPKITTEHIQLTPFSLVNVRLAAQVLSSSVSIALKSFDPQEAAGTALYFEIFDKFFDCLNVRNCTEHITKQKPFLKPYSSIYDERFDWLLHMFLPYFTNWKESIESRPGIYTKNDKARMFLSWQTYEAILITTHSLIELEQRESAGTTTLFAPGAPLTFSIDPSDCC